MPDFAGQQMGGWTNSIYNDPNNINTFLIGTNTSGIFRTINGGQNWSCVTDDVDFPVLGVNQIIAAPNNSDYLLAITGTLFIEGGVILYIVMMEVLTGMIFHSSHQHLTG